MPDTAFWQSQFLGMTNSRPARTLFEWCSHSVNVLWGANCFNTTTFLLNSWTGLFKVPCLYGMSWWHFTVSMNPEFLAKFTMGGNVAIVLIKWFYSKSTLCTSPRLHCKLNAIHGHATWQHRSPSPLTLKIEKPLPNRRIHWQTLYMLLAPFNPLVLSMKSLHCHCTIFSVFQ